MKYSPWSYRNMVRKAVCPLVVLMLSGNVFAETPKTVHLGKADVSKDDVIKLLAPTQQPVLQTRGIRMRTETPEQDVADRASSVPRALSLEVYFEFNSAELGPEALEQLSPVGEALQSNELSSLQFTLEGHTDASGDSDYNLQLSEQRAKSVKEFFVNKYSLSPERVKAEGRGESQLIEGTPPNSGINRRVTIIAQ
jgi:OOP family OmpA-OmpF porin